MTDTAVLVIDMLNTYRHEDAEALARHVEGIVDPLAGLIESCANRDDIDLIYINDNYGDFAAEYHDIADAALNGERPELVEPFVPAPGALTLTKVRHSAFYASPLEYLLRRLEVQQIVLSGQVTEQCILYSALDGYVRHYEVVVAGDAVAHIDDDLGDAALRMMERNMGAEIRRSGQCVR